MNKQVTGTTTAAYVSALDWYCESAVNKTIFLLNTSGAQSLKYKILAAYSSDQATANLEELVAEATLALGTSAKFQYNNQYYRLVLQVIDGDGHATYEVDYVSRGA